MIGLLAMPAAANDGARVRFLLADRVAAILVALLLIR
jgi:hypothetical protein